MSADVMLWLHYSLYLLFAGAIGGLLAGVLGVGGGIIIVPVLYMVFPYMDIDESVRMHLAVGTSLMTIIPTSIMSVRAHNKKGGLDKGLLFSMLPGIVLGVMLGAVIGNKAKGDVLTLVFAGVALLVSLYLVFKRESWVIRSGLPATQKVRGPIGFFIGCMSVVMGIGGGTFCVSTFTTCNIPIHRAIGTSAAIGLVIALPGAIGYAVAGMGDPNLPPFSIGYINMLGFILIIPATMVMAPVGATIAHKLEGRALTLLFAFFLFAVSIRMFLTTLFS